MKSVNEEPRRHSSFFKFDQSYLQSVIEGNQDMSKQRVQMIVQVVVESKRRRETADQAMENESPF